MGDRGQREAFVTLSTNDTYAVGCMVLAHSIRRAGTTRQLVVMISSSVSQEMRNQLASVFDLVQEVNVLDSRDSGNLGLLGRPELGVTFTKLHCWRLTQFEKCVFLDADTLVLQSVDELFDREEISAAPDAGWPDCFNSGVFVFRPSEETYQSLLNYALSQGSFDGGDQGLLNMYFSDWATKDIARHLPFIYNVVSQAFYSYLPAFTQFRNKVKIVHFIGEVKPWHQPYNTSTGVVSVLPGSGNNKDLLQLWWDIFMACVQPTLSLSLNVYNHPNRRLSSPDSDVQVKNERDSQMNPHEHSSYKVICPYIPPSIETFYDPVLTNVTHTSKSTQDQEGDNVAIKPDVETSRETQFESDNVDFVDKGSGTDPIEPQIITMEDDGGRPYISLETHYSEDPMTNINEEKPKEYYTADKFEQIFSIKDNIIVTDSDSDTEIAEITEKMERNVEPGLPGGSLHPLVPPQNIDTECDIQEVLPDFLGGLVGQLAAMNIDGSGRKMGGPVVTLDDRQRKLAWEQGRIDYLGSDSFENIQRKLDETIARAKEKSKSPEPVAKPKSPSPKPTEIQPASGGKVSETVEVIPLSTDAAVSGITVAADVSSEEKVGEGAGVAEIVTLGEPATDFVASTVTDVETKATSEVSESVTLGEPAVGLIPSAVTDVETTATSEVSESVTMGEPVVGLIPSAVTDVETKATSEVSESVTLGEPVVDLVASAVTDVQTKATSEVSETATLGEPALDLVASTVTDVETKATSEVSESVTLGEPAVGLIPSAVTDVETKATSEVSESVTLGEPVVDLVASAVTDVEPEATSGIKETVISSEPIVGFDVQESLKSTEVSETLTLGSPIVQESVTLSEPTKDSSQTSETVTLGAPVTSTSEPSPPTSVVSVVSETISLGAPVASAPEPTPPTSVVSETLTLGAPVTSAPEPKLATSIVSESVTLGAPVASSKVSVPTPKPSSSSEVSETITLGAAALSKETPKLEKIEPVDTSAQEPKAVTTPPIAPKPTTTTQAFAKFVKGEVVEPAVAPQKTETTQLTPKSQPTPPAQKPEPASTAQLATPGKPRPTSPAKPAESKTPSKPGFGAKAAPEPSKPAAVSEPSKPGIAAKPAATPSKPGFGAKPEPSKPGFGAKPEPSKPGFGAKPEPSKPGVGAKPEPSKPGIGAKPEPPKPGVGAKPEPSKPGIGAKPEPPKPGVGAKPEPSKPRFGAKPEPSKPGIGAKPEPPKPGVGAKPEPSKPGFGAKPEPAKPGFGAKPAPVPPKPGIGAKTAPGPAKPEIGAKTAPEPAKPGFGAKPTPPKPGLGAKSTEPPVPPKPSAGIGSKSPVAPAPAAAKPAPAGPKSPTSPPAAAAAPSSKPKPVALRKWPPQ